MNKKLISKVGEIIRKRIADDGKAAICVLALMNENDVRPDRA